MPPFSSSFSCSLFGIVFQMASACLGFTLFLLALHSQVAFSSPPQRAAKCQHDEGTALYDFFDSVNVDPSLPRNRSVDCCALPEVQCDNVTGHLIGLKLPSSSAPGTISSTSSIFKLRFLQSLDLSLTSFQHSTIPEEIGLLQDLTVLDLTYTNISGNIPISLCSLKKLQTLKIAESELTGRLPACLFDLPDIQYVDLRLNLLEGSINGGSKLLSKLSYLDLSYNLFDGLVPAWLFAVPSLTTIYLNNNNLTGISASTASMALSNLQTLDLSFNQLQGKVPVWLFSSSSLTSISLGWNYLTGPMEAFSRPIPTYLQSIYMNNNKIHGSLPSSFYQLVNLTVLDLGDNQLSGVIKWSLFKEMVGLSFLKLSSNKDLILTNDNESESILSNLNDLKVALCNLTEFPLVGIDSLSSLNVSYNRISGRIFPRGSGGWKKLVLFDASHNLITGFDEYPGTSIFQFDLSFNLLQGSLLPPPPSMGILLLLNNQLTGAITSDFCSRTNLQILDLSFNNLTGVIPPCLMGLYSFTEVLNLQSNRFHGAIPDISGTNFSYPYYLILSDNQFEGILPKPLKHGYFRILDVRNNRITDTFPKAITASVLILSSNNFHGEIDVSGDPKSCLQVNILDVSNNNFSGRIPSWCSEFRSLKDQPPKSLRDEWYVGYEPEYRGHRGGSYSITWTVQLTFKGSRLKMKIIPYDWAIMDFSDNRFSGEIPPLVMHDQILKDLNLANNVLSGRIPSSINNMTRLKSLDLSGNKFSGQIPETLMSLRLLDYLNLSNNQLEGRIPEGNRSGRFSSSSYVGNKGLCGRPLTKIC